MARINLQTIDKARWIAGAVTLLLVLTGVTPLCGWMFRCGCDWPWLGLDSGCNYFRPASPHRCPWCVSLSGGVLSVGLAMIAGVGAAMGLPLPKRLPVNVVLLRIAAGLLVFMSTALVAAVLAAREQGYPLGVGTLLG